MLNARDISGKAVVSGARLEIERFRLSVDSRVQKMSSKLSRKHCNFGLCIVAECRRCGLSLVSLLESKPFRIQGLLNGAIVLQKFL